MHYCKILSQLCACIYMLGEHFVTSQNRTHNSLGTSSASSVVACALSCSKLAACKAIHFAKDDQECSYSESKQDALAETKDRTNSSCYQQLAKTFVSGTAVRVSVYVTCSTKVCSVPEKIAHATASYKSLLAGSSVTYTCDLGFSYCRVNEQKAVCRNNGTWETITDTCVQNTWINPQTVWEQDLICVFRRGSSMEFIGVPRDSASNVFTVIFYEQGGTMKIVSINFFIKNQESRMKCMNAKGKQQNTITSTFVKEQRFNLTITVTDEGYHSLVDGQRAMLCPHEKRFKPQYKVNCEWSWVRVLQIRIRA